MSYFFYFFPEEQQAEPGSSLTGPGAFEPFSNYNDLSMPSPATSGTCTSTLIPENSYSKHNSTRSKSLRQVAMSLSKSPCKRQEVVKIMGNKNLKN